MRHLSLLVLALIAFSRTFASNFVADISRLNPYVSAVDRAKGDPIADYESSYADGTLVIKVRSLANAVVKARVDFPKSVAYAGKYMTLRASMSGEGCESCSGLLQGYIDRSNEGKGKKHYWKPSSLPVISEPTFWTKTRLLDPNLGELTFTFEIKNPGTYRIHSLEFFESPDPMSVYEPGRNYLVNGGAEQGFYGTSAIGDAAVRFGTKGGVIEPMKGKVFTSMLVPAISASEVRSGRASFELKLPSGGDGRLYFNPVPTVDNREFVFSFWVKASEKRWLKTGLFVASGAAYEKPVPATTEWTKITLRVPKWGEEGESGLKFYGKVTGAGVVIPYIEPSDRATYWIDDAFASVGVLDGEAKPSTADIAIKRTSNPNGIYRPGDNIDVELRLRNAGMDGRFKLTRRLFDWRNREVISSRAEESVTLGVNESVKNYSVKLPSALRGPMSLVWTLTDEKGNVASSVSTYFGVQSPCKRLEPRLSVNVMFGSPEQSLKFMKEFGIGGSRVWGPGRNWDLDYGYAYTKIFHEAGIRNLFVLGSPELEYEGRKLRGEALLPTDVTDWFARQMELVDAHRGEVDIYEFLNEYNIWKGRLKSPDAARFAAPTMEKYIDSIAKFRPLLKAHDPSALLAGCATCSTDLKFIGEFLEKGGGSYVDMVTEHAYSGNPDCPDYGRILERGLAKAKAAGVTRWAQTEAGATSPNHLSPGLIDVRALDQLENDLRNMLIAWAKGLDHFSHFQLTPGRTGTDWNLTYLGNGDNDYEDLPKPALFAFRFAADLLADSPCKAEAKLPGGYKGYVFDRGKKRVASVWKWNGGTSSLAQSPELKGSVWLDAMGNRIASDEIELSVFPVYCVTSLSVDELSRALERCSLRTKLAGGEAFDASDPNLQMVK